MDINIFKQLNIAIEELYSNPIRTLNSAEDASDTAYLEGLLVSLID